MAPESYQGPTALASSRYAPPTRNASFAALPSAGTMTVAKDTSTKGQVANEAVAVNPGAQLAIAQSKALKQQVDKHTMAFARSVSSAVSNTHQLLNLIRESIKKTPSAASDLQTVEGLWNELERLFQAAIEAGAALPKYLDKQKDSMSLFHGSMMNEALRDTQGELNLQHKKVNLQHSLILEHEQSFQEYKAHTGIKLKELVELQEKVSRLTLDKGLLKTELDKYQQLLEESKADNVKSLRVTADLRTELDSTQSWKEKLLSESESKISQLTGDLDEHISQFKKLKNEKGALEREVSRLTGSLAEQASKSKKLVKENEELETENNDLLAEAAKQNKYVTKLEDEQVQLRSALDGLKLHKDSVAPSDADGAILSGLRRDIKELQLQRAALVEEREEWKALATKSYNEYKDILPTYKAADAIRQASLGKDEEIEQLRAKLQSVQGSSANGTKEGRDIAYWRDKYEALLSTLG